MTVRRRLLWLAVGCAVLFAAIGAVFVGTRAGQRLDEAALRGRNARDPQGAERAHDVLQTISVGSVALVGGALLLVALARRGLAVMATVAVVLFGSVGLVELVKNVVVTRPDLINSTFDRGQNTWPSGHTATATALAVVAVLVASVPWRRWVILGGALYTAAVGTSTLTAGTHRPSDAVGAIVITVGIGALAAAAMMSSREVTGTGRGLAVSGAFLLAAGSAIGAVYILTTRYNRLQVVTLGRANVAAAGAIAGAALLAFGLLQVAMRDDA